MVIPRYTYNITPTAAPLKRLATASFRLAKKTNEHQKPYNILIFLIGYYPKHLVIKHLPCEKQLTSCPTN